MKLLVYWVQSLMCNCWMVSNLMKLYSTFCLHNVIGICFIRPLCVKLSSHKRWWPMLQSELWYDRLDKFIASSCNLLAGPFFKLSEGELWLHSLVTRDVVQQMQQFLIFMAIAALRAISSLYKCCTEKVCWVDLLCKRWYLCSEGWRCCSLTYSSLSREDVSPLLFIYLKHRVALFSVWHFSLFYCKFHKVCLIKNSYCWDLIIAWESLLLLKQSLSFCLAQRSRSVTTIILTALARKVNKMIPDLYNEIWGRKKWQGSIGCLQKTFEYLQLAALLM